MSAGRNSFWRDNGLSLAFGGLTLLSIAGHAWAGYLAETKERLAHGAPPSTVADYLTSGAFGSTLFENWESEFLQMALFVSLTAVLFQRGSSESNPLEEEPPTHYPLEQAPWPVRRGGLWRRAYEHSLSVTLLLLFAVSFVAHWCASYGHYVEQQREQGRLPEHELGAHLLDSQFWFESFQNWQSEFFSITLLVLFSIFLREKGSSQSKDVEAPHEKTGD